MLKKRLMHTFQSFSQLFTGISWEDKVINVREKMKAKKADALILTALDEIACKYVNPLLNNPWFSKSWERRLFKTLREKEKMPVTSNFTFSHNVFCPITEHKLIYTNVTFVFC